MNEKPLQVGDKLTLFFNDANSEIFSESTIMEIHYKNGEIQGVTSDGTIFVFATTYEWSQNGSEKDIDFYS